MKRWLIDAALAVTVWIERRSLATHDAMVPVTDRLKAALEVEKLRGKK